MALSLEDCSNQSNTERHMNPYWILGISCLLAAVADLILTAYAKCRPGQGDPAVLVAGIVLMVLATLAWVYSISQGLTVNRAITGYSVATLVLLSVVGVVVYKETLSPIEIAATVLAVAALLLHMLAK